MGRACNLFHILYITLHNVRYTILALIILANTYVDCMREKKKENDGDIAGCVLVMHSEHGIRNSCDTN